MACEVLEGFWAALEHAGLAAARALWKEVGGAQGEHLFACIRTSASTALRSNGMLPVADGIQSALEAQLVQGSAGLQGAFEHNAAK